MLLSDGQMSDYKGAALMVDRLSKATALLGDRGYNADWFHTALADRGISACIPSKVTARFRSRTIPRSTAAATRSKICSEG